MRSLVGLADYCNQAASETPAPENSAGEAPAIERAATLLGEGKYYEANLALKAVDDAVVVETFAIDALPKVKAKAKD